MSHLKIVETPPRDTMPGAGAEPAPAEPLLSVAEAARALRIAPSTLRRYIRDHRSHLKPAGTPRRAKIAVSDIPLLSQIKTLRKRRLEVTEINRILAGPQTADIGALTPAAGGQAAPPSGTAISREFREMKAEIEKLKRDSEESDLVVRQTLASVIFLIDKCNREIQALAHEEKTLNRERDRLVEQHEEVLQRLTRPARSQRGLLARLASALIGLFRPRRSRRTALHG